MSEKLKTEIVTTMQTLHNWIGKNITIEDYICTNGRTYERHQTRFGMYKLVIKEFYIRTSGSIATLYDEGIQVEFRTDSIKNIIANKSRIEMEISMKDSVWRKIIIKQEDPADNKL